MERFHAGSSNSVYNIVSGDESWIYAYEPETKNQSRVWVVSELRKENCNRRIILHHDNASSHTAHRTKEFLEQENIKLLDHPPYSPDLSPNDFYTFPKIKKKLRGHRFSSPEEAVDAYKTAILETPTSEWNGCFNNWFRRMEKCVKFRGEYFEKQ
ncbi:unnamed protein product [Parnassius mnemosyne]|uniref:Tc1-like transposase DDE domain-containing protein n=1 Tax=Parnassius mnemosyne TaxID=213953 RepID=A0AAV1LH65_9NEOP